MATTTKEKTMVTTTKQAEFLDSGLVIDAPPAQALVAVQHTPMSIIEAAVNNGIDAERLEKLMALQERWEANRAREAYNAAMSAAQHEMPSVVRDKLNSHLQTKYAKLETVAAAITPVYTRHGFSLSFGTLGDALPDHCRIFCDCRHDGGHVERIEGNFPLDGAGARGGANKTGIQAMGSTISYARRYMTLMIFNVALADEDSDGNGGADTIGPGQVAALNKELDRLPPAEQTIELGNLLRWAEVGTLEQLPISKFQTALTGLRKKGDKFHS